MFGLVIYKFCKFLSVNLPLRLIYRFSKIVSYIYYLLAYRARNIVFSNLTRIFEGKFIKREKRLLVVKIFENFAKSLVDFCRFSKIDKEFVDKYIRVKNLKYIDEALKKGGVIALTGHVGCWELGGVVLPLLGYPFNAVAMPHTRQAVESFFLKQRTQKKINVIPVGRAYKQCYKRLISNQIVALLADRRYGGTGIKAKFFGKTVIVPRGPAVLSIQTNSAVVSAYMIRKNNGFDLVFERPVYPEQIAEKDKSKKISILTQKYIHTMENYIYKYPEQWFLFYDFFVD